MTDSRKVLSDADFVKQFESIGPAAMARQMGMDVRSVYRRREHLEKQLRRQITPAHQNATRVCVSHPSRAELRIDSGHVIIGSDAHYWPGPASTMHRAFVAFCKEYKPQAVILNGDVIDACSVSRHPPIGWESLPTVQEEIEAAQDRLHEIEKASGKARKIWTLGNHDGRFETRLATVAPEYAKVAGVHLRDHFSLWEPCWSVFINDDVVVKHRLKGGIHAPHNNTMWAGRTMITGHLHSAKVTPLTDYNGTRYGVDTGCIADTDHKAFRDYTEDGPKNWRSAFGLFTFHKGRLMQPELILRWDEDHVEFRGELIKV